MSKPLTLALYQTLAARNDRTRRSTENLALPLLGLFGEVGSLLSEVKKKQRDAQSYIGYEQSVVEEMGDVLWYLAIIADRKGLSLSSIFSPQDPIWIGADSDFVEDISFVKLQPQHSLPFNSPTTLFEKTLMKLAAFAGNLVGKYGEADAGQIDTGPLADDLKALFGILIEAANEANVTLDKAASANLNKIFDRWPQDKTYPKFFDADFPNEEQLPRSLEIEIFERVLNKGEIGERRYVIQKCNGILIGDRLTDNIMTPDDYRFHDVFHYAYAAILGWSPVTRALFRLKRKSSPAVDESQDSARAVLIEEGVATFIFGVAKQLDFFNGQSNGDLSFTLLKTVRQFVAGYECDACPLWLWEEAILSGNRAFRFLRENRRGKLTIDMNKHAMTIEELPE